jgi:hypothetical protein
MATIRTSIMITKSLDTKCPACGQGLAIEIQLDLEPAADQISYDNGSGAQDARFSGGRKASVALTGTVKGTRVNHDCITPAKRGPGRPRKVDVPAEALPSKDSAEAHRDRLREHEATNG